MDAQIECASSPRFSRCSAIDEISGQADKSISPKVKMANIVQTWATQMEGGLLFPHIKLDEGRPCAGLVTASMQQNEILLESVNEDVRCLKQWLRSQQQNAVLE